MKEPIYIEVDVNAELLIESERIMKQFIGMTEKTGKNDGDHIKEFHKLYGLPYKKGKMNYAYCQMFHGYCLHKANGNSWKGIEFMKWAGTRKAANLAKKMGREIEPRHVRKHDLIFWAKKGSFSGHMGRAIENFVCYIGETLEANTSNGKKGSQRDGDGIFERIRDISKNIGKMYPYVIVTWNRMVLNHSDSDRLRRTV